MNSSYNFDSRLIPFKREIGYDEAIKNEQHDGLIVIDFTELKAPSFATEWPNEDGWRFHRSVQRGGYLYHSWRMKGILGDAAIVARIFGDYESAQQDFLDEANSTSMMFLPWIACSKKIGTVCTQSDDKQRVFFAYKNIMLDVARLSHEPGHEDFALVLAEWLFDALKAAPLKPMPR